MFEHDWRPMPIWGFGLTLWLSFGQHAWAANGEGNVAEPQGARVSSSVAASDEAEAAFRNGARAFERNEPAKALTFMRTAFRLRPDYRTAAGLGQVELHLQRHRDAAEHLEFALRHYPKSADAEGRGRLIEGFKSARSHVGAVVLEGQSAGVELWIDGQRVASLPVAFDLFVDPGEHHFVFRKPGFADGEQKHVLGPGELKALRVELGEPQERPSAPEPVPVADNGASVADWLLLSSGVLAAGALTTGGILMLDAKAAQDHVRDLQRSTPESCTADDDASPDCDRLRVELERVRSSERLASAAFIGAAAVAVAAVGLYAWLGYESETEPGAVRVSILPELSQRQAGVLLWGAFE